MALRTQIITSSLEVSCADSRFLSALSRYFNNANHRVAPENHIALTVGFDGGVYRLPGGSKEISPEIAAEAAWEELASRLQAALASWLQIRGLCLDGEGRRILVLGEDGEVLRSLAVHCLSQDLDVSSATGVSLRSGLSIPYALPIEVSENALARLRQATGRDPSALKMHDEMGSVRCLVTPADFGRKWIAAEARIDEILLLTWNPGGWSGFGRRRNPWLLEHVLNACHIPAGADSSAKLRLVAEARRLAASTPATDLHLGHLEDAPPLLAGCLGCQ
ncbi:hypothetical protein [Aestuariivirga sp.]|uniref:hypothetical protein n=1 Tax=Aestuariivirga sp. TaxID=2650926 RepID=UPI003919B301